MPLFSSTDLEGWLHRPVDDNVEVTERVVWGWLRPLLGIIDRPDEVSEELYAWAVELGAIAYVNPDGLSRYQLESELSIYGSERRDEILRAVKAGGLTPTGTVPSPRGAFPSASRYPDPAERPSSRWDWQL